MSFSQFFVIFVVLWFSKAAASAPATPYVGQQSREIKSLSMHAKAVNAGQLLIAEERTLGYPFVTKVIALTTLQDALKRIAEQ